MQEATILQGDIARDERGTVRFVNGFDFHDIKRFYHVTNRDSSVIRAFHGHMREGKYAYCVHGKVLLCAVHLTDAHQPNPQSKVERFVLSAARPQVLFIPPMYANGFRSLTARSDVIFFSTNTLAQSQADDYRFDPYYWGDVWRRQ